MSALLAVLPALPLHEAGKYVAGAYVVLFALVLIYVGIMAVRSRRLERDLAELLAREQRASRAEGDAPAEGSADSAGAQSQTARRESTLV
ncbi:MAG TPA: heme exporter protein CcmD [Solirubrobacteraceae bacterium]|nr:heme exporter protein CcmD [Solirubrobacteraceae bacterium]